MAVFPIRAIPDGVTTDILRMLVTVYSKNGHYYARNRRGDLICVDSPSACIQEAVDAVKDVGGVVFVRAGSYVLGQKVTLAPKVAVIGEGDATYIKLADGVNDDMFLIPPGASRAVLAHLYLDANGKNQTTGSAVKVLSYTWRVVLEDLTIRNAKVNGVEFDMGQQSQYSYEAILKYIDIKGSGQNGFNFAWVADIWGADLYAEGNGGRGFYFGDVAGTIFHAHAYNNYGDSGMFMDSMCTDLRLVSPHFDTNQQNGAIISGSRITLESPFAFNNSKSNPGYYNGILVYGQNNIIANGVITDTQPSKTQANGIVEQSGADYNIYIGNNARGNMYNGIIIVGSHSISLANLT